MIDLLLIFIILLVAVVIFLVLLHNSYKNNLYKTILKTQPVIEPFQTSSSSQQPSQQTQTQQNCNEDAYYLEFDDELYGCLNNISEFNNVRINYGSKMFLFNGII